MNKKKRNLVIVSLICIFILCIILTIFEISKPSEQKIVNKLVSMGEEIYVEYYYQDLLKRKTSTEIKDYLTKFKETGIKFNLVELEKYSEKFEKNIANFKSDKKVCDKEKTMIIIYPIEPYSKTDFRVDVRLDCGF